MKSSVRKLASDVLLLLPMGPITPMSAQDARPQQHPAAKRDPAQVDLARGPTVAHYTVTARATTTTESGVIPLQVSLRVVNPPAGRAVYEIPVWTPGS